VRPDGRVVAVAAAMVLFYTAGMFLNDLCDYALDVRQRPERPLPSGVVGRGEAWGGVVLLFGAGLALLAPLGTAPVAAGLALVATIAVYDLWHKTNPASPLLMAACRALVYVTAALAVAPPVTGEVLLWAGLLFGYVVGLTAIAKTEAGERLGGYLPAALVVLPGVIFAASEPPAAAWPLLAAFLAWVAYGASFVYRAERRSIGRAVGSLIAGISLLDALVLAVAGSGVGVALAFVAFAATLYLQRHIAGT
ncbi:MAG: UbiA family prenyltransferase, partial [Chloroflexota bacterium]|nr:UbiA family prenyltransferase [Chloroflexota bacterium]